MGRVRHGEKLPSSLYGVAPFSKLVEYSSNKVPYVADKIPTPVDEYGFPKRVELMRNVLNTIEIAYLWQTGNNTHHVAWRKSDYVDQYMDGELDIGLLYRECESLKVNMPSGLHAYIHAITEPPRVPPVEYMHAYRLEYGNAESLEMTISPDSFQASRLGLLPVEDQDELRLQRFHDKLDAISDPQFGVMPPKEYLANLDIIEARNALACIVKRQGFTNERATKKAFFSLAA